MQVLKNQGKLLRVKFDDLFGQQTLSQLSQRLRLHTFFPLVFFFACTNRKEYQPDINEEFHRLFFLFSSIF